MNVSMSMNMNTNSRIINISRNELLEFPTVQKYPNIIALIKTKFNKHAKLNYESKVYDPFLNITPPENGQYNLDNLMDWYNTKNPNFLPIKDVMPPICIPEFSTMFACIAKDLILLLITQRYPANNKLNSISPDQLNQSNKQYNKCNLLSNKLTDQLVTIAHINIIISLLKDIEILITESKYNYIESMRIVFEYLIFFSYGIIDAETRKLCLISNGIYTFMYDINNLPLIVYPSFVQTDFNKTIYFMQAPVVNFRITNSRKGTHGLFYAPVGEIDHDIIFHSAITHGRNISPITKQILNQNKTHNKVNNTILKNIFSLDKDDYTNANNTIKLLKPFLQYNIKLTNNNTINTMTAISKSASNFAFTYILFILLHELQHDNNTSSILYLKDLKTLLHKLTQRVSLKPRNFVSECAVLLEYNSNPIYMHAIEILFGAENIQFIKNFLKYHYNKSILNTIDEE